jgi:hypothetical protein
VPQATPLQPAPETLHTTALFVLPVTVAEKCDCPPEASCTFLGETEMKTDDADCTTNEAEPDLVGLATETAVIVIAETEGTVLGAV